MKSNSLLTRLYYHWGAPRFLEESPLERMERFVARADLIASQVPIASEYKDLASIELLSDSRVVWRIKSHKRDSFLVHVSRKNPDHTRWIVFVESRRVFAAWLSSRGKKWGRPNMPPKYSDLKNLSEGHNVKNWYTGSGLAVPNIYFNSGSCSHIGYGDGQHRTAWLIENTYMFPLVVSGISQIDHFQKLVGVDGIPPIQVDELMN